MILCYQERRILDQSSLSTVSGTVQNILYIFHMHILIYLIAKKIAEQNTDEFFKNPSKKKKKSKNTVKQVCDGTHSSVV